MQCQSSWSSHLSAKFRWPASLQIDIIPSLLTVSCGFIEPWLGSLRAQKWFGGEFEKKKKRKISARTCKFYREIYHSIIQISKVSENRIFATRNGNDFYCLRAEGNNNFAVMYFYFFGKIKSIANLSAVRKYKIKNSEKSIEKKKKNKKAKQTEA